MQTKETYMYIGTTAELIKLVPVIVELNRRKIPFTIIASGQNDIHFEEYANELGTVPVIHAITPKSKGSSLVLFSVWAVRAFLSLYVGMRERFKSLNRNNSYFLVHGDTVSSLIGALVARMYGLTLVHIESGLRSFHFLEPFPEEFCRFIISRIADIHFCPNEWAARNLRGHSGRIINTGHNTLIEMFQRIRSKASVHPLVASLRKKAASYMVLVVHRQEHVLFRKRQTAALITHVLTTLPSTMRIVFLAHDVSSDFIYELGKSVPQTVADRMIRVERLPYADFIQLLAGARLVVTDGGSNQEELSYMGKPTLIIRNRTERIEGLGKNILLGKQNKSAITHFLKRLRLLEYPTVRMQTRPSEIIVSSLFPV